MADSESSSLHSRSRRAWTVSAESDAMESSGRSNGRSSIESSERPKTQAGEDPDSGKLGSSSFSKLLNARRRRKKKNNNRDPSEEPQVPGVITEQDLQHSRSNESREGTSGAPSSNNSSAPLEAEPITLLTDDSEPERYERPRSHSSLFFGFLPSLDLMIPKTNR